MKKKYLLFFLLVLFIEFQQAKSQNILLWKNVGSSEFISPETGNLITPDFDIRMALAANARSFVQVNLLPDDLSVYDMIFITLGFSVDCG
jgi:hypothetical protein